MWTRAALVLLLSTTAARAEKSAMSGDASFAVRLFARLAATPGNLFFSPASARMALTMTYAGARGETANEMAKALSLPPGPAAHDQMADLLDAWHQLANPPDRRPHDVSPEMQRFYEEQ